MKTVHLAKGITLFLFILILGGFVLIANKISEKSTLSKPKIQTPPTGVALSDEENIESVTSCGDFVCVLVTGKARSSTLFVLDPATGSMQRRISFDKSEK